MEGAPADDPRLRARDRAARAIPRLRGVIWQSLALSVVLQVGIGVLAWWALQSFATVDIGWVNSPIRWLGAARRDGAGADAVPASFGIVISIFMEKIADIVEGEHYPRLGPRRGISVWTGIWSGILFLVTLIVALNLVMLPFYLVALFVARLGAVLFYGVNGWLAGRMY